jgi:hypothetical protein
MPGDSAKGGGSREELDEFRALQEEMLYLSREYGRARTAAWAEETRNLTESWNAFFQSWQASLEQTSALAAAEFAAVAVAGQASSNSLAQSWQKVLAGISGEVDQWAEHFLEMLEKIAVAWAGTMGNMEGAGGWSGFLGPLLDFGGLFHQGGMVAAPQGLVFSPGSLANDEQLILAQAGEGILPRESMALLGEGNFEALRTGRFEVAPPPGAAAPRFDITIQVQSLDAAGVAGLDWDRLVQRHLLPALQREFGSRW